MNTSGDPSDEPVRYSGMGLDLTRPDEITDEEIAAFDEVCRRGQGRPHPGLRFWLEERVPGPLKRYRQWADQVTDLSGPQTYYPYSVTHLMLYAWTGFERGVRYSLHNFQRNGLSKPQILELIGLAFIWINARGMETIASVATDFEWRPGSELRLPKGWTADPDAFKSGLDFSSQTMSEAELKRLEEWYIHNEGEVPPYVRIQGKYKPGLLKAYRNRWENALRELPKQIMPYVMIQFNCVRGFGAGVREGVLLAQHWGITNEEIAEALSWGSMYGGIESISEVAGSLGTLI